MEMSDPIFVIRETISRQTYPIFYTTTRTEAQKKIDERVDILVREHEIDGGQVFVHRGADRTSIFKQSTGWVWNGNMNQKQTLSLVEVPHSSTISKEVVLIDDDDLTLEDNIINASIAALD